MIEYEIVNTVYHNILNYFKAISLYSQYIVVYLMKIRYRNMRKQDIEHVLNCLQTKTTTFKYVESYEEDEVWGGQFTYEIFKNDNESLVKYSEAESGYQNRDSGRANFVLNFMANYLKGFYAKNI